MGFLDFLKGIGNFVKSGIQKVAGFVGKVAPVVSGIAGMIPTPMSQGIAAAANLAGSIANGVNGTDPNQSQSQAPQPQPGVQQPQTLGSMPAGTQAPPPPAGPIM
jgi:hypothetical protein